MPNTPRPFLIDTDAGSDDAIAIIMALRCQQIKVEAITVVAGNVPIDQGVQNALYMVEICERTAPVYKGSQGPLVQALGTAQHVHGQDGMGDIGLHLSGRKPAEEDAIEVILNTAFKHPGELTLVTLGPLTNIACAIQEDPNMVNRIGRCVVMGGLGEGHGNITPVAEYNMWADPEAAKIVFESGMPLTMVGWDISRKFATVNAEEMSWIRGLGRLGQFSMDIQSTLVEFVKNVTQLDGIDLPDPIAMAIAIKPEIILSSESFFVQLEIGDGLCRGQTIVDRLRVYGQEPNVEVVSKADRQGFLNLLKQSLED